MKYFALACLLFGLGALWIVAIQPAYAPVAQEEQTDACTFAYEEFPADDSFPGSPALVDFTTNPNAGTFRTRISEASAEGPNFAAHYTVATWGCGTSCQVAAIVDAKDGRIAEYGILATHGLGFRIDSALFVVNPPENLQDTPRELISQELKTFYAVMEGGSLRTLCEKPAYEAL